MGKKKIKTARVVEIRKAKAMEHLMRMGLEQLKSDILFREYVGFEMCYNLFKDFYSDRLNDNE